MDRTYGTPILRALATLGSNPALSYAPCLRHLICWDEGIITSAGEWRWHDRYHAPSCGPREAFLLTRSPSLANGVAMIAIVTPGFNPAT